MLTEKAELFQTDDELPGEVNVLCDSKEKDFLSYLNLIVRVNHQFTAVVINLHLYRLCYVAIINW